jgi:hypothetical protein
MASYGIQNFVICVIYVTWIRPYRIPSFVLLYQSSSFLCSKVELEGEEKRSKEKVETTILAL